MAARYSDWSPWSVCNVTCGGGNQIRTRLCLNPPLPNGESPCVGSAKEERICGGGMCPKPSKLIYLMIYDIFFETFGRKRRGGGGWKPSYLFRYVAISLEVFDLNR